jgi:AraC family transcriptional regulator
MNTYQSRGSSKAELSFEDLRLAASELHDPPTADYKLCLVIHGEARLSYRVQDRWQTELLRPGMFTPITPPHVAATFQLSGNQRHLMISISEQSFTNLAADTRAPSASLEPLYERAFRAPFLAQLCRRAWSEANRGDALGSAFANSIVTPLVAGLLRNAAGSGGKAIVGFRCALSQNVLKQIRKHCLDHLHEPIRVALLARLAGLGLQPFGRAFKVTTGLSPQQYLIALRTHRARELLLGTAMPVADIALACGFCDQPHLTSTFTRTFGSAPSTYRRVTKQPQTQ